MPHQTTRFFTAADGARLAYLDQPGQTGGGLPLLCLAGLTRSKEDFDEAMPALTGMRVIRMDYRGRGESSFTGAATYNVGQEAADALALLDHLGIGRAAVLGTSRGGIIAMHLARQAHDRLLGICLVDIGPEIDAEGLALIRDYVGRRPAARSIKELAARLPRSSPGFSGVADTQWQAMAARLYTETATGLELRYDPALREAFLADFTRARAQWPEWQATRGLPVALIRGEGSNLLSRDVVAQMQQIRPDMLLAEVPGRGHVPFLDEAESVALLRDWMTQLQKAPTA